MNGATSALESPLEYLTSPVTTQEFFLEYWSKNYLLSEGTPNKYEKLFSWSVLSETLSTHRFDFPRLRLLAGGSVIHPDRYILHKVDRRGNPYTTHDAPAVRRLIEGGAMLHVTSIGEACPQLASFAASLETLLCGRVQVNLHAGYGGARGFHTHWDGHDVFAIQIDGAKKWRLFGFTDEAPLAVPPEQKHGAPNTGVWEGVMRTGNMLYLPRGYWHATEYVGEPSLHLTFAVQHPTGIEFLQWVSQRLAKDACVRRDIPAMIFDMNDVGPAAKTEYIAALRSSLLSSLSPEVLNEFLMAYRATLGTVNHIDLAPNVGGDA